MARDHTAQTSCTWMAAVAAQQLDQVVGGDEREPIAYVDRTLNRAAAEQGRQVENRPRGCRTRNLAPSRQLVVENAPRAMHPDSKPWPAPRTRPECHVDRPWWRGGPD